MIAIESPEITPRISVIFSGTIKRNRNNVAKPKREDADGVGDGHHRPRNAACFNVPREPTR